MDPSHQSVVHVYYGEKHVKEFEQSMISTWYDLLSSLGGIVALITGGSLVTIVEITYLMTGRFGASFIRNLAEKYKDGQRRRRSDTSSLRDDDTPPFVKRRGTIAFVN